MTTPPAVRISLPVSLTRTLSYLAYYIPDISVIHRVACDSSRVAVENIHQVSLLAVLQYKVQLVHLKFGSDIHRTALEYVQT